VLLLGVLAAGASALVAGELDPTFSDDGVYIDPMGQGNPDRPGADLYSVVRQPDGKIVVAGQGTPSQIIIARFNEDGTLDPTFGSGGKVLTKFGRTNDTIFTWSAAVQADGKIVLGGVIYPSGGGQSAFFARVDSAGVPDDSFGTNGAVVRQYGEAANPYSGIQEIQVLPDGRILGVGGAKAADGHAAPLVVRLDGQGNPDGSFGSGGKATPQIGSGAQYGSSAAAFALQPDGKILITGNATDDDNAQADAAFVARLDAEGKGLDAGYGSAGKFVSRLGAAVPAITTPKAIMMEPDGKAVLAGSFISETGVYEVLVARVTADGDALDSGFATDGRFTQQLGSANSSFEDVLRQPDGKIVLTGNGNCATGSSCVLVARMLDGGSLDPSFGTAGKYLRHFGSTGYESHVVDSVLDPKGKLVAVGGASFNVNGNFDTHGMALRLILNQPPTAAMTASPGVVGTNQSVAFSDAGSADPDGSIVDYSWDFGDGTTASGAAVNHAYSAPGSYTATLTVRDDYGLTASATQALTVTAVVTAPPRDTIAPVATAFAFSPASFAVARAATPLVAKRAKRGSSIKFKLSEAASLGIVIARERPGLKRGKRCIAPIKGKKGKRCTRLKKMGTLKRTGVGGANKIAFSGRIGKRALGVSRYRATLVATDAAGNKSARIVARFRIVSAR
jgi:uncharacterized delta-60 repeat protein